MLAALGNASQFPAIYPKEVVDAAGDGQIKDFVGTGPFRFVERVPDRYTRMARFDRYARPAEAANGYGGRRTAYVDEVQFIPVPDVSVRAAGVESGEYHFSDWIAPDNYDRLTRNARLDVMLVKPNEWVSAIFNKKQSPFTNRALRQAFVAALDMEPIMKAAVGASEFYRLDPSLIFREQVWWSDVGKDVYNRPDREKAKRLMQEAGYKGEPIRWMATQFYDWMYKSALAAKQQLEDVGFNIDLQVLEWATVVQRRNDPKLYDVFTTGIGFNTDPSQMLVLSCDWPGWTCDPKLDALQSRHGVRDRLRPAQGGVGGDPALVLGGGPGRQARRLLHAPRQAEERRRLREPLPPLLLERGAQGLARAAARRRRQPKADEAIQRRRALQQGPRRALVDHAPAFEHEGRLGEGQRGLGVLLDQDERRAVLRPQAPDGRRQLLDDDRRQPLQRLVEEEQRRVGHERPRDREHLLLAPRQVVPPAAPALGEPREQRVDARQIPTAGARGHGEVLLNAQRRKDLALLSDPPEPGPRATMGRHPRQVAAAPPHHAASHVRVAHDREEERGLPHPVPSQHREAAPRRDLQRDPVERHRVAVAGPDALEGQQELSQRALLRDTRPARAGPRPPLPVGPPSGSGRRP